MWHLISKCSLSDGAIELTTRALSVSSVRERCLGVRFLLQSTIISHLHRTLTRVCTNIYTFLSRYVDIM